MIGLPHSELGEMPAAFIVATAGMIVNEREILELCEKRLARYKIPSRIIVLSELPHNSTGKVLKKELRRRYV